MLAARLDQGRLGNPYRGVSRFSSHGGFGQELWAKVLGCD
jgi:hypothetical protein